MDDFRIITQLEGLCRFRHSMTDGRCTELSFYNDDELLGSTIRRHRDKHQIVKLIERLSSLKNLNLRKSKLGGIPHLESTSLEHLDLSSNDLIVVPDWVTNQPNMRFLNLGSNQLEEVPDLSGLPLETIKLHKNRLTTVPALGCKAKSLNLFLNRINSFPEQILGLSNLEVLTMGVSDMTTLPPLKSLQNLRWLTVTVSKLVSLPDDICSLSRLEGLQLAKNRLKSLPADIGSLQNLTALTLYSNDLSEVPDSFFRLRLRKLNLTQNPVNPARIREVFGSIDFMKI